MNYRENINETYKMKENIQNGTISELCNDELCKKPSSNPNDILKPAKNFYTKEANLQKCHC